MPFPKPEKGLTKLSLQLFAGYLVDQEGFLQILEEHSQGSSEEHFPEKKMLVEFY